MTVIIIHNLVEMGFSAALNSLHYNPTRSRS